MGVKINLKGGLGNQLFQYSAARALSLENNTSTIIDPFFYKKPNVKGNRHFELEHFPINAKILKYYDVLQGRDKFLIDKYYSYVHDKYKPRRFIYDDNFWNLSRNVTLSGYFQSVHYFYRQYDCFRKEIDLTEMVLADTSNEQREKFSKAIGIHVRRGDFLNDEKYRMANPTRYYRDAIDCIRVESSLDNLIVFSDDIDWCKAQREFKGAEFRAANLERPHIDLFSLAGCGAVIAANSTFSWWAAWFAAARGKCVVVPNNWRKGIEIKDVGLLPEGWFSR